MRRFLILIVILVFAVGAVSAAENTSEKLTQSYFYDGDADEEYEDDTVVTHDVVKYYGDKDTKFRVKVYDDNYEEMEGVYVKFTCDYENYRQKTTNARGNVYFPINYRPGTYYVDTEIECEDGKSYYYATNKVKIKSTIPTGELVKFSASKKKFKIKFLDTKGKKLKNTFVKLKIKGKKYKLKTDSKGIVKIKSSFKVGKHRIVAYNPKSKEKRKIAVVVLKKGLHKIKIRIDDPTFYFPTKKLKNGDRVSTVYETKYRQYNPGVYVETFYKGLSNARHTKLVKAKFFFKNKKTGKVIVKTSSKVSGNTIVVKPVKGYSPYKAHVWYRDKV